MLYTDKIDLHMHTTVSDGTDSPEQIIDCVRREGISLFAVTDHDDVKACEIIRSVLKPGDPRFIPGIEFSCKDEEGQYHVLGYGFDPLKEAIRRVVGYGHRARMKKVMARLDFLKTEFGFAFPEEEIRALLALDNPGKPHIGNLMVKFGYAESKDQAIRDFIDRKKFRNEYVRPEDAIQGILNSGGIPVLAHPIFGSGDDLILGEEMDARLRRLIGFGLRGAEVFYSGFTPKLRKTMLTLAEKYDLYVTAGSDYHGSNKLVALGDTGLEPGQELPEGMTRFLRDVRYAR